MADITLCNNSHCPLRNDCYRAQATPNQLWQSYSDFKYNTETGECEDFIKYW